MIQRANGRAARQRPGRQIARNTSRHSSSAISDIIHARCFAMNYHKSSWEDNKVSASNAPRARGSALGTAVYRGARRRNPARVLHPRGPHLYAVLRKRAAVASSTRWCTLVSAGHLGPAGVDGGRVPITQHTGHPPSSPPPLPPPSGETSPLAFAHRGCNGR